MRFPPIFFFAASVLFAAHAGAQETRQQTIDRCRAETRAAEDACKRQALDTRTNCDAQHAAAADKRQCAIDSAAPVHACFAAFVAEINGCLGWEGYRAKDPSGTEVGYDPVR